MRFNIRINSHKNLHPTKEVRSTKAAGRLNESQVAKHSSDLNPNPGGRAQKPTITTSYSNKLAAKNAVIQQSFLQKVKDDQSKVEDGNFFN
mmetsp:Transcript_22469/g.34752  ORF Transcript_22469/g.34752 Transcript_22469/m.34752 type:complete len:91 (+) Transcript_22469:570-842(+)